MPYHPPRSWIERTAVRLGLIAPGAGDAPGAEGTAARSLSTDSGVAPARLRRYPTPDRWTDHVEFDPAGWPREAKARHYRLLPTTCFNCESACGLLAYIDKETGTIRKLEGNPLHPGSRGRNCAKGPATLNQVTDPDRIRTPMKRNGPRGSGRWQAVSWEEALADIGGRIRRALQEGRRDEIVYHVGRPGAEGFMDRVLQAWGIDGHNSHTNICSSGARFGYAIWCGYDRPSPDYADARFILALNAHLESGHYFNPHAQRISEGLSRGARLAVVDPRLSNTAAMAHYWLPTRPGTEAALLLGLARVILEAGLYDRAFIQQWVNWEEYLAAARDEATFVGTLIARGGAAERSRDPAGAQRAQAMSAPLREPAQFTIRNSQSAIAPTVDDFIAELKDLYSGFTPEFVESECGVPAETVIEIGRLIGQAGPQFCSHTWRGAASAHVGGWQVARCLFFLHVLTGSVGTRGGCSPAGWHKYKAGLINPPPPQDHWNELHWPREYPLSHYEMSFLLPHFLKEGRGRIDVYFTRVFNPVWTYPDGFTWIEALRDESRIGLHVALTPTWNETALFADYVLPMGHGPERHDLNTYETHNAVWIAFRQPVLRAAALAEGCPVRDTRDVNPGQVWEEDEFWIALTWAIDPDGSLGIRRYFESANSPGTPLTVDEYYTYIFERVPGLPETAKAAGLTPLDYMRRVGAFEVKSEVYRRHERRLSPHELAGAEIDAVTGVVRRQGAAIGLRLAEAGPGGTARIVEGFPTPSRKLEFYSATIAAWGWPEYALPGYIRSHVYDEDAEFEGRGSGEGTGSSSAVSAPPREPISSGNSNPRFQSDATHTDRATHALDAVLLPTFRLPTLIHTRSGGAKWLNEISQRNPLWINPADARQLGLRTGDLARVSTEIGWFVDQVWVTEAIRPGVVACSHHLGRWRRPQDPPNSRWSGSVVAIDESSPGVWRMRRIAGPQPFESADPDSGRIWWREGGVPQNLTFPVHPDPISGMHCWHQRVRVEPARPDDACGDVYVDTNRSMEIYRQWLKKTRWPVGPPPDAVGRRLRRPLWLARPLRPAASAYLCPSAV